MCSQLQEPSLALMFSSCAGVLSSFGELEHMRSGQAELRDFDPFAALPKMDYKSGYQKLYYVLDSFDDAAAKLGAYCDWLKASA